MKSSTAYFIGGVIALVCVAIGVYYLIPSTTPHIFGHANVADTKHSIVFFGLAVVSLIGARFAANSGK